MHSATYATTQCLSVMIQCFNKTAVWIELVFDTEACPTSCYKGINLVYFQNKATSLLNLVPKSELKLVMVALCNRGSHYIFAL